jgi:hypothetical protein
MHILHGVPSHGVGQTPFAYAAESRH